MSTKKTRGKATSKRRQGNARTAPKRTRRTRADPFSTAYKGPSAVAQFVDQMVEQIAQAAAADPKDPHARHDAFAWQTPFLAALRLDPNVSAAAVAANVTRQYVYEVRSLKNKDGTLKEGEALEAAQEFAAAWDDAIQTSLDALESAVRHRAANGLIRKKFTRTGEPIMDPATGAQYVEYEYSDSLAQFLLRVHRYGDKHQHEITGKGGAPIEVRTKNLAALDDSDLESEITDLLAKRNAALGGIVAGTGAEAEDTAP